MAGNGSQTAPALVEGALATTQRLVAPSAVAVGRDGSIFIGDSGAHKIYRIATDGTIRTFAGNGTNDYSTNPPNGGPAPTMTIDSPEDIAVNAQGTVYCSDAGTSRLFEISPDGTMRQMSPAPDHNPQALAIGPDGALYIGQTFSYSGVIRREPTGEFSIVAGTIANNTGLAPNFVTDDGAVAAGTRLAVLHGLAIAPNGDIFTAEAGILGSSGGTTPAGIRRITQEAPGVAASEIFYPSADGSEVSVFSLTGRHLRTMDSRTGVPLYSFAYDPAGRLASITDQSGRATSIERTNSVPTAIVAPFGQRTELTLTAGGYLETVRNPAGDTDSLGYSVSGGSLLSHHRSPEGQVQSFEYDQDGRLSKDTDASGGYHSLAVVSGSVTDTTRTIERTTRLGRITSYQVKELLSGIRRRLIRGPDQSYSYRTDSLNTALAPYGEVIREVGTSGAVTVEKPVRDSRYGMLAPVLASVTTTLPSGLSAAVNSTRDWGSAGHVHETVSIAGQAFQSDYDSTARRLTVTSPLNRVVAVDFDALGRQTQLSRSGLAPVDFTYDPGSKLVSDVSDGGRNWHYDYDASGRLHVERDPLLREVVYGYDAAGRVLSQALPGGRTVGFKYDRNGSLTSLTPPGRPAHRFHYTATGLNDRYVPPVLPGLVDSTQYAYNFDGQLTTVTRPGGEQVALDYDVANERLLAISEPRGTYSVTYWATPQPGTSAASGQVKSVSSPDSIFCAYAYDGPLLTSETWSGRVQGSVSRTYDTALRLASEQVNGAQAVSYGYDGDGLVSTVSGTGWTMSVARQAATGLVSGTSVGSGAGAVASTLSYDSHGELSALDYTKGGLPYSHQSLVRDSLGRIVQIDETVAGASTSRTYGYTAAGWLASVSTGLPATSRSYEYDGNAPGGNGNRTAERDGNGALLASATYDAQDRLLTYADASYSYTAAGELMRRATPNDTLSTDYDALGNLVSAGSKLATTTSPPSGLSVGTLYSYQVDGENRRVRKLVNGEPAQGWLYRDGLSPVAELDEAGAVLNRYVYATRDHAPDLIVRGDSTYRVITDQLGSVRAVVNIVTGTVAQRLDYDAWGNLTLDPAPGFQSLGYAGGIQDRDTKLVRFGARDLEPGVGRWTCKDPAGYADGVDNLYTYVASSPVDVIDSGGESFPKPDCTKLLEKLIKAAQFLNQHLRENAACPNAGHDKDIKGLWNRYRDLREQFERHCGPPPPGVVILMPLLVEVANRIGRAWDWSQILPAGRIEPRPLGPAGPYFPPWAYPRRVPVVVP